MGIQASLVLGPEGDIYLAGVTGSTNFPTVNAFQPQLNPDGVFDGAIVRMKGDGSSIVFSTYLGGSGSDVLHGIAVDKSGNIYLAGHIDAPYPPPDPASQLITNFVTIMKHDGSGLLYSSPFGPSTAAAGGSFLESAALDPAGYIYLCGFTGAPDFPVANAFQPVLAGSNDAWIARLNPLDVGPLLQIVRTGETLVLTWPASNSSYVLEEAATLSSPAAWLPVQTQPVVIGDQETVVIEISTGSFYRLRRP
jgi:Beta-propeller repeat